MISPHPEDIALARQAIREARKRADIAKGCYWARMDPKDLPWHRAAELVGAVETLAWNATWLAHAVERLSARLEAVTAEQGRQGQLRRIAGLIRGVGLESLP